MLNIGMRKFTISALVLVCLTTLIGIAAAVRPSGPGQTDASNSLSVVVAADAGVIVSAAPPRSAVAMTPSDTADASPGCNGSVFVGIPDAGTMTVYMCGNDASVAFNGLGTGVMLPGCFRRIEATGTAARGLVCLSQ